jgi:GH15 family glucan-1,4-alpha-glucosidase
MPRDLPLANGSLLVNFDARYQLRDVYFPHVGQENHTLGSASRLGLWAEGRFTWLSEWELDLRYRPDTLVTDVRGAHPELGLRLAAADAVDCERNVLLRRLTVATTGGPPAGCASSSTSTPTSGSPPWRTAPTSTGPAGP